MGIVSVEQTDNLYWLGRYAERVYTTMRLYFVTYDSMLDEFENGYKDFCIQLEIPDIYKSGEDFERRYAFDEADKNSIMSNLKRAYDNAVVLRETIGSEALAYIQLAIYEMQRASASSAPMIEFQKVEDDLMAFWGILEDTVSSENTRNILKVGRRVERVDLYARLRAPREDLKREIDRLSSRFAKCDLSYSKDILEEIQDLVLKEPLDYQLIVQKTEGIVEV